MIYIPQAKLLCRFPDREKMSILFQCFHRPNKITERLQEYSCLKLALPNQGHHYIDHHVEFEKSRVRN